MACGCVPVQSESEEVEVRSSLAGVIIAGSLLVLLNLVLATVEGVLGAEADAARMVAQANGVAARLEAEGLGSSSTTSAVAALLGAFGADLWQVAVAFAVVTASMAALSVPLTVTALVRKSRRLTRLAQGFSSFTTVLILVIILVLGAVGHLSTRDNAGLSGMYIAQGIIATMTLGNVALRLESLVHDPSFWLFAKTQAIDLNTEVMLELEKRRDEEEARIRQEMDRQNGGGSDDEEDAMGEGADASAIAAFFSTPSKGATDRPAGLPAATGAARMLSALAQAGKAEEARDAAPAMPSTPFSSSATTLQQQQQQQQQLAASIAGGMYQGVAASTAAGIGFDSSYGYGEAPAPAPVSGAHWRADGSYVDEQGGVTDAYGGYTWPDGAGYTDASGYFYAADGYGGYAQYPSQPPGWSQAAQQAGGAAAAASEAPLPAQWQAQSGTSAYPGVTEAVASTMEADSKAMSSFGFQPAASESTVVAAAAAAAAASKSAPPPRTIQRVSSDESGSLVEPKAAAAVTAAGSPHVLTPKPLVSAPPVTVGVSGPDDKLVVAASATKASTSALKPSAATTSAISRIRKMAPKRITLPTNSRAGAAAAPGVGSAALQAAGGSSGASGPAPPAATAAEAPPARFPLF